MKSNYVFNAALASAALGGLSGLLHHESKAQGAVIDAFTFEGTSDTTIYSSYTTAQSAKSTTTAGTVTGTMSIPVTNSSTTTFAGKSSPTVLADSGTGSAYGVHAAAATVFSEPAGNGSTRAFSSNNFATGDYYEFDVSTSGVSNILVSFDSASSGTGPKAFSFAYSTDGATFVTAGAYAPVTASGFNPSVTGTAFSTSFDLSAVTALNNLSLVAFRLAETDSPGGTGGTSRIDNFVVSTSDGTPEPASLALLTTAGSLLLGRRRRA